MQTVLRFNIEKLESFQTARPAVGIINFYWISDYYLDVIKSMKTRLHMNPRAGI